MSRLEAFEKLKSHPFYKNDFAKLARYQVEECLKFITDREHLSRDDYALAANRWCLGQDHHKNMTRMADILSAVNVVNNEK